LTIWRISWSPPARRGRRPRSRRCSSCRRGYGDDAARNSTRSTLQEQTFGRCPRSRRCLVSRPASTSRRPVRGWGETGAGASFVGGASVEARKRTKPSPAADLKSVSRHRQMMDNKRPDLALAVMAHCRTTMRPDGLADPWLYRSCLLHAGKV
jgi:hypothetical protein